MESTAPAPATSATASSARPFARIGRYLVAIVKRFIADRCLLHASALTYTSLLSIVPLLALVFSVLKGLHAQHGLEPLLLSRLALEPETASWLITYIDNTNVTTLGTLGAVGLLMTAISVLGAIENSFNHIWRVPAGRPWWRKATDYLSTVLLTPFMLLAAVGITSFLQQQVLLRSLLENQVIGPVAVHLLRLAPYAINVIALALLFTILPNRRPNLRAIAVGALIGGCVWQLLQASYVALQIGVARYNAIYGALAQLPVTLVWLYLSWIIVLGAAEIAAVVELGADSDVPPGGRISQLGIALEVLLRAGEGFRAGTPGLDPLAVARALQCEGGQLLEIADRLEHAGFLAIEAASARYLLARDPAAIDLATVAALFDRVVAPPGCDPRIRAVVDDSEASRREEMRRKTLADLLGDTGVGPGDDAAA